MARTRRPPKSKARSSVSLDDVSSARGDLNLDESTAAVDLDDDREPLRPPEPRATADDPTLRAAIKLQSAARSFFARSVILYDVSLCSLNLISLKPIPPDTTRCLPSSNRKPATIQRGATADRRPSIWPSSSGKRRLFSRTRRRSTESPSPPDRRPPSTPS